MSLRRSWISGIFFGVLFSIMAASLWLAWEWQIQTDQQRYRTQVLRDLIAMTDNALIIVNPDGRVVEWGPGATKLFGWSDSEVLGSTIEFMMPAEYHEKHCRAVKDRVLTGDVTRLAVSGWAYRKAGDLIPVRVMVTSFKNHTGFYHMAIISDLEKSRIDGKVSVSDVPKPKIDPNHIKPIPSPVDVYRKNVSGTGLHAKGTWE